MFGYLKISQDISGYLRISLWGELPDAQPDRGNGSRLYEVNLWLWRYGRGQPRTMSIEEAEAARQDRVSDARARAEETKKRRREAAAREGAERAAAAD